MSYKYRNCLIFLLFIIPVVIINAQNNPTAKEIYKTVKPLFDEKQYEKVVEISDVIFSNSNIYKDDFYYCLIDDVAIAYYRLNQEDTAVSTLKYGINLLENQKMYSDWLVHLYHHYLEMAHAPNEYGISLQYDEYSYREYSLRMLPFVINYKDKSFYYKLYGEGLNFRLSNLQKVLLDKLNRDAITLDKYNQEMKEAVKKEKKSILISDSLFDSYFTLITSKYLKDTPPLKDIINTFDSYLKRHEDEIVSEWLADCYLLYESLAGLHYRDGNVEVAAEYYGKYIGFLKSKDPTYIKGDFNSLNEDVLKYIAYLQGAMRFGDVDLYCKEVISNNSFDEIRKQQTFNAVSYDKNNTMYIHFYHGSEMVSLIDENSKRKISPITFRFDDEVYPNINNDGVDYCIPYIYSEPQFIINNEKLAEIWNISDNRKQIDALLKFLHKDLVVLYKEWFGSDLFSDEHNAKTGTKSFEDVVVAMGKNFWSEDTMGFETWLSCARLANLYYIEGDFNNAVKWQKMASEIVEIPTDANCWENLENSVSSYNLDDDNILITHVNVDFFNKVKLAFYYKQAKLYEESAKCYSKCVELYLQVLQKLFKGSDMFEEKVWDNHKNTLYNILSELVEDCKDYSPYGDLVLELSAMQKGFLSWQKIALKDAVNNSHNSEAKSLFNKKTTVEKDIENSYYHTVGQLDRADLFGDLAKCEDGLRKILGTSNILDKTIISKDEIKGALGPRDVYVDFVEVSKGTRCNYLLIVDSKKQIENEYDICELYAVLMRGQWDHPRVVYIGENTEYPLSDLVVYKLNDRDAKKESERVNVINSMYTDTVLAHYIWDTIVAAGDIKEGDNVFYVPTGLLTKLGLENLSLGENAYVSGRYNVYRLSSARELLEKKSRIDCGRDVCYGIGGLKYNDMPFDNYGYYSRKTALSSMFYRDSLVPLSGSRAELSFLKESFGPAATITSGDAGTEANVLREIARLKPSVLHIGTHGFNCIGKELSEEEERFLFGDRDSYVSPMENSLYRTGLYMGVSRTGRSQNASEGIITAKEISMMDLSRTKLVVLSSCSSALGTVNSEGVYGLQRGLKLAGAESMLVSLWDVNDKATELLMHEFYEQLAKGRTRREALLKAQEAVREYDDDMEDSDIGGYKTFAAPYYWAGFVLIDGNE